MAAGWKKKVFSKKNFIRAGFVFLLAASIYFVRCVLEIKSDHGINQQEGIYWQPGDSIDVVMMGSSHVHCNINTGLLWEKYGIAAYDYSGAEQPLWMTYYYLKEMYKYQKPSVVVLDVFAPARFREDYQYTWVSENIYGMKFSLNKLKMMSVSVEPSRFFEYFPSFAVYHSRYDNLNTEDFNNFFWDEDEKEAFKGYVPQWNIDPQQRPEVLEEESGTLTAKSEKYLRKIIEYTREKNIRLALIAAPYVVTEEDKKVFNRIAGIAASENITFIDYNEYYDEMALDFEKDFRDNSHLNYWGSCKFTAFLGEFLKSDAGLPDRRGQEGYESWEENAKMIYEELEKYEAGGYEQE